MISYDAFVLWILDSDGDWRDIDVSFSDDVLHDVASNVITSNPEHYPSGKYRLDKVGFVVGKQGELCTVEHEL